MTTIRKIVTSKVDGNSADSNDTNEIRPFGEIAVYLNTEPNPDKLTLMMFDGTRTHMKSMVLAPGRLYGSDADSGDGNGLDTIKLIPDASLSDYTGNDQYLIIDPTNGEPGHIHIRAGGVQDQSTADLFLGGEQTHVKVSDTYDNVVIRTSTLGEGVTPHTWTFDNTGTLTFPGNSLTIGNALGAPSIISAPDLPLQLVSSGNNANTVLGWIDNLETLTQQAVVVTNNPLYVGEGDVGIVTGDTPNVEGGTGYIWNFTADGNLIFPDDTIQTTAFTGNLVSTTDVSVTSASNPNNGPFGGMVSGNLEGNGIVVFGPDGGTGEPDELDGVDLARLVGGTITLSGAEPLSSPILGVTSLGNKLYSIQVEGTLATVTGGEGIGLTITVDPLSTQIWTFGTNGTLTFPGGATVRDLPGEGPDDSVLILGAGTTIAENQRAARIGINGSVEGVSIGAGANDWSFTNDGTLTLPNNSQIRVDGDNVEVGGMTNFNVEALGVVNVYTDDGTHQWQFGDDGRMYLPSIGDGGGAILRSPTNESIGISAYNDTGEGTTYTLSVAATGPINIPTASTGLGRLQNADGIEILTNSGETAKLWKFSDDGSLTLPFDNKITVGGDMDSNSINFVLQDTLDPETTFEFAFDASMGMPLLRFPDDSLQSTAWTGGRVVTAPTASTGAEGDKQGDLAFTSSHLYYCIADYNQVGHQVTGSDYLGRASLNTNAFQLTKTADTLQITVGDIISDSDGGATSTVVTVSSDENYTYVGTGGFAYAGVFPLTFTSTDYVSGGNIWKRVAWSGDTW